MKWILTLFRLALVDFSCQLRAREQVHLETFYHEFGEQERGEHFQKTSMQTYYDQHDTCFTFLWSLTLQDPLIHHYDLFLQSLRVVLKEEVSYRLKKVEVRRKDAIDQVIFNTKKTSTRWSWPWQWFSSSDQSVLSLKPHNSIHNPCFRSGLATPTSQFLLWATTQAARQTSIPWCSPMENIW